MKSSEAIKLTIWLVLSILLYSLGLDLLTAANTIANIAGLIIIIAVIFISIKTNCLRTLKFHDRDRTK